MFLLIKIIGYGQQYLNRPHSWLKHVNEALYPFYILHQTVIIWIGYYICQLDWSISEKYWTISFLTLVSCIGFYVVCIQPSKLMRFLFGMKQKKRAAPRNDRLTALNRRIICDVLNNVKQPTFTVFIINFGNGSL